jgi:glycine/D-amino acid oxidase-like deaminating enzyme
MRVAIVGGGVIALLTAVNCVSAGHDVVMVDQADIPFSGATSFDRHRVIRALHTNDPAMTAAAMRAHREWLGLQERLSVRVYEQTGVLTVLGHHELPGAAAMLARLGALPLVLTAAELVARYPQVRFPAGAGAIIEANTGVLLADRILAACVGWLRLHSNAALHPHREAVEVDAANATVRLADGEVLAADAVLLAIGPWSRTLLDPELAEDLVLRRQSMVYYDVPPGAAGVWSRSPAMLSLGPAGDGWLVPPVAMTPLKFSAASACRIVPEVGDNSTPPHWRDHLADLVRQVVPGLRAEWLMDTRDCYYLARADTHGPMLATLGERVVSYAACGGSSFKFAPLIAQSLTARLTGADPVPTGLDPIDVPYPALPALRGVS